MQCRSYTLAPSAIIAAVCDDVFSTCVTSGGSLDCARDWRYTAIALRSVSDVSCRLCWTTAAIGPNTAPRAETPVRSKSMMSLISHEPRPVSRFDVSDGAYQFCTGINPPDTSSPLTAPSMLREL